MADFDVNGMRAIVQATDLALQNITDTTCEKCAKSNGQPYLIHYARQVDQSQTTSGQTTTTITTYNDISARAVNLCDACVTQYRLPKRNKWIVGLFVTIVLMVIGIIGVVRTSGDLGAVMYIVTIIAGVGVIGSGVEIWRHNSPHIIGRQLAGELHEESLEREGYDSFWWQLNIEKMRSQLAQHT